MLTAVQKDKIKKLYGYVPIDERQQLRFLETIEKYKKVKNVSKMCFDINKKVEDIDSTSYWTLYWKRRKGSKILKII